MRDPTRRTVIKSLGASTIAATGLGTASADPECDPSLLRLMSEESVPGTMEVVTQKKYAYVATGSGMSVVDIRNPRRPETVAEVDLARDVAANLGIEDPEIDVLDVKVEGDVAALANDGSEDPGGISLYDVSDRSDPQFLAQYEPDLEGPTDSPSATIHNCFLADGYAYLTLSEPWNVDLDGDGEADERWFFGDTGVDIADVSDPANPEHAGTWFLKDDAPAAAKSSRAPCHDIYVQDGVCYTALWDAGTAAVDVRDPADPEVISRFGSALDEDDAIPAYDFSEPVGDYFDREWDDAAYLTVPGNAHYVQPSPDGNFVYVGAETFPKNAGVSDPGVDDYGGITVFDTTDLENPERLTRIDPPVVDEDDEGKLFTSHNFDVTRNRLHTSWYHGGVHLYDVSKPSRPKRLAGYDPEGYSFWTVVCNRGFTVGGVYGAGSDGTGGITILQEGGGKQRSPEFEGSAEHEHTAVTPEPEE